MKSQFLAYNKAVSRIRPIKFIKPLFFLDLRVFFAYSKILTQQFREEIHIFIP